MLVHKETMGVLECFWNGQFIKQKQGEAVREIPVMVPYTLKNTGLNPAEWWEVDDKSTLGRKLHRYYPYCTAIMSESGELVDVDPWPQWKIEGLPEPPPMPKPKPIKRVKQRRRKRGLFEDMINDI